MKEPVVPVLVSHAHQVLDLRLLLILVLFGLLVGKTGQLNINSLTMPLDVAATNEVVFELVYILNIEIKETMTLPIPSVRCDNDPLPYRLDVDICVFY